MGLVFWGPGGSESTRYSPSRSMVQVKLLIEATLTAYNGVVKLIN
jgi:hypothetical protein